MLVGLEPLTGETHGRAVERVVADQLQHRGYSTELQKPRSRGGDVLCWDANDNLTIVEVRTRTVVEGHETPFFDIDSGLKTHRELAKKYGAYRIVVVYGWVYADTDQAFLMAEEGNAFEAIARRNVDAYMQTPGLRVKKRKRPIIPVTADDMKAFSELFPLQGQVHNV